MADGRWTMTAEELDSVVCGPERRGLEGLPNRGLHRAVDDRSGNAPAKCAFCGSVELQTGFGGFGEGFGYRSVICSDCGGSTDFIYKDDIGKYFDD